MIQYNHTKMSTFKKLDSMLEAIARASSVLPVPGGPYNNTPFGGLIPTRKKSSGLVGAVQPPTHVSVGGQRKLPIGKLTSRNSRICSERPPTAENGTLPGSSFAMLYTVGSTSRGKIRMMVSVVMSNATRAPFFNLARSTFARQPTT